MRILLISANRSQLPVPVLPVGVCLVAEAAERSGHRVRLLDLMFEADPLAAVRGSVTGFDPELIGISVRNIDNNALSAPCFYLPEVRELTGMLALTSGAPVVLGGAAMGVMPEQILRFCPSVCCGVTGPGESVFPLLAETISRGESPATLPGVALLDGTRYVSTPRTTPDPGALCRPPDYRRWLDLAAYRYRLATYPLRTRCGCPFNCVYCTYPLIEGNRCVCGDPVEVAAAVRDLAAAGMHDIEFVDSVFNVPREHALGVCEELVRSAPGNRLQCLELNPLGLDRELIRGMERAGFRGMGITLESASDRVLEGLGKGFDSGHVHRAAAAVRESSIPCAWIFLLGGPGETQETVGESLRFARSQLRPRDVAFFNIGLRIYPGTGLEGIARREGVLQRPAGEMLEPVFYLSPAVEREWLERELGRAMGEQMNIISGDSLGLSFLPFIYRMARIIGMRPPVWRYTRLVRRCLRLAGMDV